MLEIIEDEKKKKFYPKSGVYRTLHRVICHCGESFWAERYYIEKGRTKSCGCSRKTHSHSSTPTYQSWVGMKYRCDNPNASNYKTYGAKGITYDPLWSDFVKFLEDMGERQDGSTLDRIDVNGNYCKENCRWADTLTQNNNRTNNNYIEYKGKTQTLAQWCRELDINYKTVSERINGRGWAVEKSFETPCRCYNEFRVL